MYYFERREFETTLNELFSESSEGLLHRNFVNIETYATQND